MAPDKAMESLWHLGADVIGLRQRTKKQCKQEPGVFYPAFPQAKLASRLSSGTTVQILPIVAPIISGAAKDAWRTECA
jgi:hypothetical protein